MGGNVRRGHRRLWRQYDRHRVPQRQRLGGREERVRQPRGLHGLGSGLLRRGDEGPRERIVSVQGTWRGGVSLEKQLVNQRIRRLKESMGDLDAVVASSLENTYYFSGSHIMTIRAIPDRL